MYNLKINSNRFLKQGKKNHVTNVHQGCKNYRSVRYWVMISYYTLRIIFSYFYYSYNGTPLKNCSYDTMLLLFQLPNKFCVHTSFSWCNYTYKCLVHYIMLHLRSQIILLMWVISSYPQLCRGHVSSELKGWLFHIDMNC